MVYTDQNFIYYLYKPIIILTDGLAVHISMDILLLHSYKKMELLEYNNIQERRITCTLCTFSLKK